jgi:hypothetical protein
MLKAKIGSRDLRYIFLDNPNMGKVLSVDRDSEIPVVHRQAVER